MTKSEIIDSIIDNDIDNIVESHGWDDHSYIADLLRDGMKGYENFTDQELIDEYNERFGDNPIIGIQDDLI